MNWLRASVLPALAAMVGIAVLLLLARSVENSSQFSRWQPWILLFNILGVLALAVMLTRKIWQLVRDYRDHVPGSRLTMRTVVTFGALVIVPLLLVYLFSLGFLNRGIDSWFRVEVKQGLGDALVLSRSALDLRMREQGRRLEDFAQQLSARSDAQIFESLETERRRSGANELIMFGRAGEVLAASSDAREAQLDVRLPPELLLQVRDNHPYSSLEPLGTGEYLILNATPVPDAAGAPRGRFVLARYGMPQQLAALTEAVQHTYSQYGELATLREPLKSSFRVTLTVVLLLAMLSAIYLAIQSAQSLVRPVQDLMKGTRAVGQGDFGTRLPLSTHDEMGFLVQSFNEMTKRLRRASDETARSHALVEQERERLAVILAGLSTGVLVVDAQLRISTSNAAAEEILGADLAALEGQALPDLAAAPRLQDFARLLTQRLRDVGGKWQGELSLPPDRVLRCACEPLAAQAEPGFVIVFDDITNLLHAQRDAAWGEVARRLAHEIKNPLTPIQLAAERLNRRLHDRVSGEDAALLDRATHTIVQQVESLKGMVNAFSEYARAPDLKLGPVDVNALVNEVVELYRSQAADVMLRVNTDPALASLLADRGRLRQVLNNLMANGLEAVEGVPDAWVAVETRLQHSSRGDAAVVTVSDNGHGFQKEMLARVFDPYVTSKTKGTGLGLAIVKKIAEEHGGRVEADNRPDKGAYVRVILPVAVSASAPQLQRGIA
ncbi:MAG: HAMP domain-containing protein [Nevskiaceae bacterium]|nr:HAMP domain-containing protein [Nevskiaceae bacterium]